MRNHPLPGMTRLLFVILMSCSVGILRLGAQTWEAQVSGTYSHWSGVNFVNDQLGWVCGSSGKLFKTTNGGGSWFEPSFNLVIDLSDVWFINNWTGWATGLGGIILKTDDGGRLWIPHSIGMTGWVNTIRFVDSQNGWAAGDHGTILRTTNGGINWIQLESGTAATIMKASFVNTMNGWMVTNDGEVLKTVDGWSWTKQTISPPNSLRSVAFLNASLGWMVGDGGRIFKTTNGGTSWTEQVSGTSQQLNDVAFATADSGWAAGNAGTIRHTTNGGAAWTTQSSGTTQDLLSFRFLSPRHGYCVGVNNTILEYAIIHSLPIQLARFSGTVVSGSSVQLDWTTISETNNYGFEIQRRNQDEPAFASLQGVFIPGHGTTLDPQRYSYTDQSVLPGSSYYYRLKQIDLDGTLHYSDPILVSTLTGIQEKEGPTEFGLSQNYPNPFNPSTKISYSLPAVNHVTLKVYDVLGKEVATLVNEVQEAGSRTVQFDARQLSSGVYLYRLTAGQFTVAKRMVIAK